MTCTMLKSIPLIGTAGLFRPASQKLKMPTKLLPVFLCRKSQRQLIGRMPCAPARLKNGSSHSYSVNGVSVWRSFVVIAVWLLGLPALSAGQAPSVYPHPASNTHEPAQRHVSWKLLVPNVLRDQKEVWLLPASLAHGRHWAPTAGVILATAGLVALDPHDGPYFRRTQSFNQFNRVVSGTNTGVGMALLPLSVYALSRFRRDSYAGETVQLAAEAVLDAEIPALVARGVTRRLRPREIPPGGDFGDTWFRRNNAPFYLGAGGFPSGHTVEAFSIATVFAERYHRHRWAPWMAYGLAGVVGFSRITRQAHFPSDVFVGAVLGYTIAHYVVLRRR